MRGVHMCQSTIEAVVLAIMQVFLLIVQALEHTLYTTVEMTP